MRTVNLISCKLSWQQSDKLKQSRCKSTSSPNICLQNLDVRIFKLYNSLLQHTPNLHLTKCSSCQQQYAKIIQVIEQFGLSTGKRILMIQPRSLFTTMRGCENDPCAHRSTETVLCTQGHVGVLLQLHTMKKTTPVCAHFRQSGGPSRHGNGEANLHLAGGNSVQSAAQSSIVCHCCC